MGLTLAYGPGQTPLDEDEKEGLLIPTIATKEELDEYEQQNIEEAILWSLTRRFRLRQLFTEAFVKDVHKRMYGNVWAWAGEFRKTNKNIGVDKWQIAGGLKMLLDDAAYWTSNKTHPADEIAVRFKHRIVSIHCFPNGNGRHSRLMADIMAQHVFKQPVFTWGANSADTTDTRSIYLKALRAADMGNIIPLLTFATS